MQSSRPKPPVHYGHGFTVIELLVTLAVTAVLITVAVPSYRAMINNNSVATQVNNFLADLYYARSEAITRGLVVRMCKSANGSACIDTGGWEQGWIVYADAEDDRAPAPADILRISDATANNTTLLGNNNVANDLRFDANGFALGKFGTVFACDSAGKNRTRIIIAATGRALSQPDPTASCTP